MFQHNLLYIRLKLQVYRITENYAIFQVPVAKLST